MSVKRDETGNVSYLAILKGSVVVLVGIVLITVVLGTMTHLGWSGLLNCSGTFYLVMFYLTVMIGSVFAGINSQSRGWITGVGVGLLASIFLSLITILTGESLSWLLLMLKMLINCLIGAFGGIVGVNMIKK